MVMFIVVYINRHVQGFIFGGIILSAKEAVVIGRAGPQEHILDILRIEEVDDRKIDCPIQPVQDRERFIKAEVDLEYPGSRRVVERFNRYPVPGVPLKIGAADTARERVAAVE